MANASVEAVTAVVGRFYEAAYDQDKWPDAIAQLSQLFDCSRVCIARAHADKFEAIATVLDPEFCSESSVQAHFRDPLTSASYIVPVGVAYTRRQIIDETEFRGRELWNDWYLKRDLAEGLGSAIYADQDSHWSVQLHRGARQSDFSDEETSIFRTCLQHMMRAGEIGRQLQNTTAFANKFAGLPMGVIVVDGAGVLSFINGEAERLLSAAHSSLTLSANRLVCVNARRADELSQLIGSAVSGRLTESGGTMLLPLDAKTNEGHLVVSVAPFASGQYFNIATQRYAAVILRNGVFNVPGSMARIVRTLFQLSPAEANLCLDLAGGMSLKDAAFQNNITFKTARTYLERIFAKTGTRQQSQLIALIKSSRPLF
jgi:DNA-binding CsgD family transcriptional regulator/PAS domain-containing protein